jgi:hypothetical protein
MTADLAELEDLDDLEELDPSEYAAEDLDDAAAGLEDDAPPRRPTDRSALNRTKQQRLRRSISAQHSATQAALLELVSDALAAKIAHDVDAHPLALEALTAFTTTATALAAAITTEQQTIREAEDDHR